MYKNDDHCSSALCLLWGQKIPQERQSGCEMIRYHRSGTDGTHAYTEAATKWAELIFPGWENDCGSHPQHHRVWFKFVDLVTRIGSARLRCTELEVFNHLSYRFRFWKVSFYRIDFSYFTWIYILFLCNFYF